MFPLSNRQFLFHLLYDKRVVRFLTVKMNKFRQICILLESCLSDNKASSRRHLVFVSVKLVVTSFHLRAAQGMPLKKCCGGQIALKTETETKSSDFVGMEDTRVSAQDKACYSSRTI